MDINKTLEEARQAIEAGDFEKAETLKNQARSLVELQDVENSAAKVEDAKAARVAADEAPPVKTVGHQVEVTEDEADKKASKPWKSFGEYLKAVHQAGSSQGMKVDPRLKATGLSESISSDGGFLVTNDFSADLLQRTYDAGLIAGRTRRVPISANANGLTINAIDETSRATGSRFGGVQAYWLNEGGTKTASDPKFRQIELKLNKLVGLSYATDELLADAAALESVIRDSFAQEFAWQVDNAIIRGTGAGQPLGILNAASIVSVGKEAGQAATTLVYENVLKMWSRMWAPSRANAVWLINQDVEPQLWTMDLAVGTGGLPVMLPPAAHRLTHTCGYSVDRLSRLNTVARLAHRVTFSWPTSANIL